MKKLHLVLLFLLLLTGCANSTPPPEEEITLLVETNFPDNFMSYYGAEFESTHPHVKLQFVQPGQNGTEKPDIRYAGTISEYVELVKNGSLIPLDPYLEQTNTSPPNYAAEAAFRILRDHANGLLHGISVELQTLGLFYNVDLFDKYDVPYPQNRMTWAEVIELAQRFPTMDESGNALYGLSHNYYGPIPFLFLEKIAQKEGLYPLDEQLKVQVDTPEWEYIWETVIPAMKSGHLYLGDVTDVLADGHFLSGNVAMVVHYSDFAYQVSFVHQIHPDNLLKPINWNVVTAPVGSGHRNQTDDYTVWSIYGISADSEHKETAWDLLQSMLYSHYSSDDYGEIDVERTGDRGTRMSINIHRKLHRTIAGRSLEPLFQLDYQSPNSRYDQIPYQIVDALREVGAREVQAVLDGQKTIKEALQTLQHDGQLAVDAAKLKLETEMEK